MISFIFKTPTVYAYEIHGFTINSCDNQSECLDNVQFMNNETIICRLFGP